MFSLKNFLATPYRRLFFLALLLSFLGLIAVYNSSVVEAFTDFNDKFHFVKNQLAWLFVGIVLFLGLSRVKPQVFQQFALPLLLFSFILMFMVFIPGLGPELQGARRWLVLGPIHFQPSEFFKLALIIYLSLWLSKPRTLTQFLGFIAFSLALLLLQPDLGTSVIIATTSFILYYLSGADLKKLLSVIAVMGGVGLLLIFSSSYRMRRLTTFLDPTQDPLGASYHVNQILLGLGSGGLTGIGLGKSRQKYAYLPESTTDSIFVVIAEELGFIGASVLVVLLLLLVLTGFKISSKASSQPQKLLSAGIVLLLLTQIFVNLGSMVALLPLTGMPLPLISYGGTSLISTFASLGILASIARQNS